jgi:HTH-type transcriptional regulator/antitoxin HipB
MSEHTIRTDAQLSQLLASARKARGLTQSALAERMGVSQQLVSKMERDILQTTVPRLLHALRILQVHLVLRIADDAPGRRTKRGPPVDW